VNDDAIKKLLFNAQADQAMEAMKTCAVMMTGYFNLLLDGGLKRREALELTLEYQQILLTMSKPDTT
jgi:hypothetical protein